MPLQQLKAIPGEYAVAIIDAGIFIAEETLQSLTAASKEQSQDVGEVNMAFSQLDKVTQSNVAAA